MDPTQPPIQWVARVKRLELEAHHFLIVLR
jgi:hypothetical protein